MSTIADVPLGDLCRDVDPETVTAFVADLYEARGWDVDRIDEHRFRVSTGDDTRLIGVVSRDESPPQAGIVARSDVVVTPYSGVEVPDGADVEVVDEERLGRQLAYAVDRSVARTLLEDHFGWSPPQSETSPPDSTAGEDTLATPPPSGSEPRIPIGDSRLVVVSLLIVAVAAGTAIVVAGQLDGPEETASQPSTDTPARAAPSPEENGITTTETEPPETPATDDETVTYPSLPPGIDESGGINRVALTDAHESVLDNQSYRLTLTYRERKSGTPTGVYSETIRVENATTYSVSTTKYGTLQAPLPSIAETDVFANGSVRFERGDNGTVHRITTISYDRYLAGHVRFLSVFLDVGNSSIADYEGNNDTATVYVVTEGNRATLIENTTGGFTVREDGLVTGGRWTYEFSPQLTNFEDVTGTFAFRISDVGSTSVRKPAWMPANTTTGNETRDAATPTPTTVQNRSSTNESTATENQSSTNESTATETSHTETPSG